MIDEQNALVISTDGDNPGAAVYMRVRHPDGTPIELDENGYVKLPPAWLRTAAGAVIDPEDDGSVKLPAASGVAIGDGLEEVDDEIVPKVTLGSAWPVQDIGGTPLSGSLPSVGGQLFRHANGLFGLPRWGAARYSAGATLDADQLTAVTSETSFTASATHSLVNPSPARRMIVAYTAKIVPGMVIPKDGQCAVALDAQINGGGWTAIATDRPATPTGAGATDVSLQSKQEITKSDNFTIAAGATATIKIRCRVVKEGSGSSPVFTGCSGAVAMVGVLI